MNTEHEKLQDIRVRQAIQRAVNVDQIQSVAFTDVAEKAHGLVPPGLVGNREAAGYPFDVEAAKALIEEAGVTDLSLDLVTLGDNRQRLLAAQIVQENLAQIGITVNVKPLDTGAFWELGREDRGDAWKDSQMWIMRFGGNVDPSDYFQWFTTDQKGNWNWERWTSEEFDTRSTPPRSPRPTRRSARKCTDAAPDDGGHRRLRLAEPRARGVPAHDPDRAGGRPERRLPLPGLRARVVTVPPSGACPGAGPAGGPRC